MSQDQNYELDGELNDAMGYFRRGLFAGDLVEAVGARAAEAVELLGDLRIAEGTSRHSETEESPVRERARARVR